MSDVPLAFVISPQPWAGFHVSKHHYAVELADRGWQVVFVDPPAVLGAAGAIELASTDVPGITSLRYQTFFPYKLKFHSRWAFDALMRRQARRLVAAVGRPDLVWDFDNAYQFRDLSPFEAQTSLFHLVDDVSWPGLGDKRADHVFYLHPSFCTNAGATLFRDHEIGHGLGKLHAAAARRPGQDTRQPGRPHIGFVGNLQADWLDWPEILQIVDRHSEARFTFWGPLPSPKATNGALADLLSRPGIRFPGLTTQAAILEEAKGIDLWLLPFQAAKIPGGKPLNSHKVLEYLSTGRAVAMNWLEAFEGNPLVEMQQKPDKGGLAELVRRALANLDHLNSPELMGRRRAFALERTYYKHLEHIQSLVPLLEVARSDAA
jgi:hypothetical protein